MRCGSRPRRAGNVARVTRQPAWRSTPPKGGPPPTLPVSRIAAGSKPASIVTISPSAARSTGSNATRSSSTLRQPSWMPRTAADLLVRVGREVLGHEVDEAAFLLEEPEETERLGTCRLGGRRGRRGRLPSGRRDRPRRQERDHHRQREGCADAPGESVVGDEEVARGNRGRESQREEKSSEEHARLAITWRRCGKRATPACIAGEDAGKNSAACPGSSATCASSPGT